MTFFSHCCIVPTIQHNKNLFMEKFRLDHLLVRLSLVESRAKAQTLIASGWVQVEGIILTKSGQMIAEGSDIRILGKDHPWVSRAGQKLAHAIEVFGLDARGCHAIDIGASTGGFTDVLLHHGASTVYAVDVGHGQMDAKLRYDSRVTVLEKTNARTLSIQEIPTPVNAIVCDASFISLKLVLPAALALTTPQSWLCALIKPQFEAGQQHVGKGGVVKNPVIHDAVCQDIAEWLSKREGWKVEGITPSPITGAKGNVEFLIVARKQT
jgi:23S rRNA (cytidine1920-2'-O)/16S rRNA (cytidine1409-2'-O)-methyltransferase